MIDNQSILIGYSSNFKYDFFLLYSLTLSVIIKITILNTKIVRHLFVRRDYSYVTRADLGLQSLSVTEDHFYFRDFHGTQGHTTLQVLSD